jgi:putative peptidoglycan lipid II flippase
VLAGVAVGLLLASILGYLVIRSTGGGQDEPDAGPSSAIQPLTVSAVNDLDPQGEDTAENPELVERVIDGNVRTGWRTTTYFGQPDLGGLKTGVGVVLDLGGPRELSSVRVRLAGGPTDVSVYASSPGASEPRSLKGLRRIAELDAAGPDASVSLPTGFLTRYVVVWLTELPEVEPDSFRGEIREITVEGRA